jgi:hypothetical protein
MVELHDVLQLDIDGSARWDDAQGGSEDVGCELFRETGCPSFLDDGCGAVRFSSCFSFTTPSIRRSPTKLRKAGTAREVVRSLGDRVQCRWIDECLSQGCPQRGVKQLNFCQHRDLSKPGRVDDVDDSGVGELIDTTEVGNLTKANWSV